LKNLTVQQPFEGNEMVAVGNGAGLKIDNAGATFLHNPNSSFKFHKNVLHCPNAFANLLSIQKLCIDNDYHFIVYTHFISFFFVKDNLTKTTLLEGKSENRLYPPWKLTQV
jgi:hypothetical protein